MIYDKPLLISKYFLLYGRHHFGEKWHDSAITFIKGVPKSSAERNLKKRALKIKGLLRKNLWNDIECFEVSDNGRSFDELKGKIDLLDFEESICVDTDGNQQTARVLLKKDHFLNALKEHEMFDKKTPNSVVQKYKNILVSEAILKHLHFIGEPQNNEVLVQTVMDNFKKTFDKQLDQSMVRENVKRMVGFWKIHKP